LRINLFKSLGRTGRNFCISHQQKIAKSLAKPSCYVAETLINNYFHGYRYYWIHLSQPPHLNSAVPLFILFIIKWASDNCFTHSFEVASEIAWTIFGLLNIRVSNSHSLTSNWILNCFLERTKSLPLLPEIVSHSSPLSSWFFL